MSIVGSYEFHRTGDWMLNASKIVVYLHDTIETQGLRKEQVEELNHRVHAIVSAPVEEHIAQLASESAAAAASAKIKVAN
jgi:hypothetical protein